MNSGIPGLARGLLICAPALMLACSNGEEPAYANPVTVAPARVTVIDLPASPYQPVQVSNGVRITGRVLFSGAAPSDSTFAPTRDLRVCGERLTIPVVEAADSTLGGVVVWLSDLRAGRPLPVTRRFELTADGCKFDPVVQTIVTGGALNVRNDDPVIYRNYVLDTRTGETVARLPFTDAGQVIPLDRQLRAPGLFEIRSSSHPWMRAWVAAFDHPYFDMTTRDGAFAIGDVPAGQYTLKTWHPYFGVTSHPLNVGPNGASVAIRYNGAAADSRE